MRLLNRYENINFPEWALCALVNGDDTGLTDEEISMLNAFEAEWNEVVKSEGGKHFGQDTTGEAYFTHYPEFGLACDCFNMTIFIWGE